MKAPKHKKVILERIKHERNLSRNDELKNSCGWSAKDKINKNKKKYVRKLKHKLF